MTKSRNKGDATEDTFQYCSFTTSALAYSHTAVITRLLDRVPLIAVPPSINRSSTTASLKTFIRGLLLHRQVWVSVAITSPFKTQAFPVP